jgi:hypothetical protein
MQLGQAPRSDRYQRATISGRLLMLPSFQVENSSFAAFYNMNLTTVTFSNLTPNTTYQFLSRTRNWQNIPSSNSAVVIVTATYANPPGPSLFNTAPAEVFFSSITLDWDNNGNPLTPPTSYQMQVSSSSDFARASSSTTFNTFATTATLLTNTTYFFRVAAFHRFGSSSAYNAVVSTPTLSRAPAFQGFNIGVSSISVRFSTNTNPARFATPPTAIAMEPIGPVTATTTEHWIVFFSRFM